MMNEIQVFNNPEFGDIRTVIIENEPWWVGKDVAEALDYKEPTKAAREKVDLEDRGMSEMDTPSGRQNMLIINESGLYSLILSSKLPSAKKFKRWITSEVLPVLRKTGRYEAADRVTLAKEDCLRAAETLSTCTAERLPYVAAVLRQAGFKVPEVPVLVPTVLDRRGTISEEERDRMQYEALLQHPQLIPEYPEALKKHPDLEDLMPKRSNKPAQLQRANPRDGYSVWFNLRKLKRMMKERGWNQMDLSRQSGIDKRSIGRYLSGASRPGTANRNILCDAIGVKHGYFDK